MTRIDRRALFASGAAAALLAATGLSPDAKPTRGGRLRVAVSRDHDQVTELARGAVFDTLTEVAPDGVLRGELAVSWQSANDARHWEFKLRDSVDFHDGSRFGAPDAVASLLSQEWFADRHFATVEATGPSTLRIELHEGNPQLPFLLANQSLSICPADCVDSALATGIGTGLYAARRIDENRHFLGERVASHYKDGQAGWLDAIDVIAISDPSVRAEALRDGFVDVAELPAPDGVLNRGEFAYHPSSQDIAIAARRGVGMPRVIGARGALDDGRLAERWWIA
ncbi:ABC transporter substrate-binding protein [Phaeobacter sp. 22II1-1F12B]|uniref:ABC transporter substrate-binding protein n=1 Tax=Phaeobacter sp. 22II1-1F12B TaxID=1317111 RepID=UPI000B520D58|nr:ABC transporter substrate-binding protein [Phaeobacter sp. 22II1-1F12B]OWU82540.1 peptide ABC transporter substrate-binding protein [Phaeobacter sp. 22II1-1F12B]